MKSEWKDEKFSQKKMQLHNFGHFVQASKCQDKFWMYFPYCKAPLCLDSLLINSLKDMTPEWMNPAPWAVTWAPDHLPHGDRTPDHSPHEDRASDHRHMGTTPKAEVIAKVKVKALDQAHTDSQDR